MASSFLIRDAIANAQQELAKKRSLPTHSPTQSPYSASASTANKRPKTSHPPSRLSSSTGSTAQSIKDAVAASRTELESRRKHSLSFPSSSPPPKPHTPYERFMIDHWEDDEYDGLDAEDRRSALNKRFEAVSFSKKEAWTSEWQREVERWEAQLVEWETEKALGQADNRGSADHGASGASRSSFSAHKSVSASRQSKSASSSSAAFVPNTSSTSSSPLLPQLNSASDDFTSSPLIAHQYTLQGGQVSLVPHVNKYSKAFLTLTFPITRVTALVSLLPEPATSPMQKQFPLLTVATISRAVDYFIQHVSALVLAAAVASGSKVLRPEDYRAVIMRRPSCGG